MVRRATKISMLLVEFCQNEQVYYVLNMNRSVKGYNFISETIKSKERPLDAAIRALKDIEHENKKIQPISSPFKLPYYSSSKRQEENTVIYLYKIKINNDPSSQTLKCFTAQELVEEAWKNPNNPFIRFVLKNDIIEFPEDKKSSLPFVFNIPAIEYALQQQFEVYFKNVLGVESSEAIDLQLHQVNIEDIAFLIRTNRTLKTKLDIRWSGSDQVFTIEFPVPYHGVFIIHADDENYSSKWIWHPHLIGKPGDWIIKKYHPGSKKESSFCYRRVLDQKKYWETPLFEEITEEHIDKLKIPGVVCFYNYTHAKKIVIKKDEEILKKEFIEKVKNIDQNTVQSYDEQDISYQRLLTFSSYFYEKFFRSLILTPENNKWLIDKVNGTEIISEEKQSKVWESFLAAQKKISSRLFPFKGLQKQGIIQYFTPLNNIDTISQLTSFQRYAFRQASLENLPAIYRQNHPSFKGYICSVETPESMEIGITLHLARGIQTDIYGNLSKSKNNQNNTENSIGYGASLVPFYQHNDAARTMMGAKNLKQALPLDKATEPWVTTGNEKELSALVRPLVNKGVLPNSFYSFKPGVNLLVAYMPWYGLNFEDAIVANEELVMNWQFEETHSVYIKPGFKQSKGKNDLSHIGEKITPETEIAHFKKGKQNFSIPCGGDYEGILTEIHYHKPQSSCLGGLLKWKIEVNKPLQVGDKLMARYGNKGVVSVLLPKNKMPRLPVDERLPEELRDKAVDLILNPHGVISRMNLGQLLETHFGLAKALGKKIPNNVGAAFKSINTKELSNNLTIDGLIDEYGKIHLTLPDGKRTELPVVVGYQYFVKLNHLPDQKVNVRRDGKYNLITGQPVRGKTNRGGQRIGEMEMWALAAHQADKIITNILGVKSDPYFQNPVNKGVNQTLLAIQDHFFGIGINLIKDNDHHSIQPVTSEDVLSKCRRLETGSTKIIATRGKMVCPNDGCKYQLLKGKKIIATGTSQRTADFYVTVGDLLRHYDNDVNQELTEEISKTKTSNIKKTIKLKKGTIELNFTRKARSIELNFSIEGNIFHAYSQVDGVYKIKLFLKMRITCCKHNTNWLICQNPRPYPLYVKGGLYDSEIFGEEDVKKFSTSRWGYIKLPFPLENPLFNEKNKPQINFLPIIPSKYRYTSSKFYLTKTGVENDITLKYASIFNEVKRYNKKNIEEKDKRYIENSIYFTINDLFKEIKDRLFGKNRSKHGLIRQHGLGRRVDYSGRLVIAPDPDLDWDECGVPIKVLIVLLGEKIANKKLTYEIIRDYLTEHPDTRVLLNRPPTLHKYNIMSFRPVPVKPEKGMVLKINPLICKAFSADYDGDEMAIHMLLDAETNEEAKLLSPIHKHNLLSVANGDPLVDFDQDFVLGHYLITGEKKDSGIETIKKLIQNPNYKAEKEIPKKMHQSFEAVTRKGISFGFLELEKCIIDEQEKHTIIKNSNVSEINKKLESKVKQRLVKSSYNSLNPGFGFAVMALSGARGKKQTRQIIASRGVLSPGVVGFEAKESDFIFKESLIEGMSPETSFFAAMNARSSMIDKHLGTAEAGSLSRKLVLALWPWHIVPGNCGRQSITNCKYKEKKQICSVCYGTVPGYNQIPDVYPAGLIAAQSFGERGTQLSMQSFHTGEKVISLNEVTNLLGGKGKDGFFEKDNCEKFIVKIQSIEAYKDLDVRHIKLIWLAIHSSTKKSLSNAWENNKTPLSSIAGPRAFGNIKKMMFDKSKSNHFSPIEKLLTGLSPVKFR